MSLYDITGADQSSDFNQIVQCFELHDKKTHQGNMIDRLQQIRFHDWVYSKTHFVALWEKKKDNMI